MTPGSLARIKFLQDKWRDRTDAEQTELDTLRRELAASPEVADDPRTPFVNEARSPNLDGTDWQDRVQAICCDEVEQLFVKYGRAVVEAAVQVALTRR